MGSGSISQGIELSVILVPQRFFQKIPELLHHDVRKDRTSVSLDHVFVQLTGRGEQLEKRTGDLQAAGLALLVLSLISIWVEPVWGFSFLAASVLAILVPAIRGKN